MCLISGYPIDNARIGKTPPHWKWKLDAATSLEEQIMFVLYGCLLGDPFAWATQQDGYLMHDVFPIEGNKYDQLGTGSEQTAVVAYGGRLSPVPRRLSWTDVPAQSGWGGDD